MNRVHAVALFLAFAHAPVSAQAPLPTVAPPENLFAPSFSAAELERVVSPIALYPDMLLAQVLAAATCAMDVPDAARWADDLHYLTGAPLAAAIAADRLPWDVSVQALLPFSSVLKMMASAMPWTEELGDAVLAQPSDVMDAVERMRRKAQRYGYLRSNAQVTVTQGPYAEILPVDPSFIIVPYDDPHIVFGPPPSSVVAAEAVRYGVGVRIGTWFRPWGWGSTHVIWRTHTLMINNSRWSRGWGSRGIDVHP